MISLSAVDTVERFQGGERDVMVVTATESDREYLQIAGDFLLDPRRLTVALSRAKHKMVLIASRSVFTLFSMDEETFTNGQLWKNLLRHTCTELLWEGIPKVMECRCGVTYLRTTPANSLIDALRGAPGVC